MTRSVRVLAAIHSPAAPATISSSGRRRQRQLYFQSRRRTRHRLRQLQLPAELFVPGDCLAGLGDACDLLQLDRASLWHQSDCHRGRWRRRHGSLDRLHHSDRHADRSRRWRHRHADVRRRHFRIGHHHRVIRQRPDCRHQGPEQSQRYVCPIDRQDHAQNWLDPLNRIETFQFADGSIAPVQSIAGANDFHLI